MAINALDFLNANSLRSFPLKEGVTRISDDAFLVLPDDLIVDLSISVSSDPTKRYFISKVVNQSDTVTIEITDDANVFIGNFAIDPSTHTQYKVYPMISDIGANGRVTIDSVTTIAQLPKGTFSFTIAATELEMRTIVPSIAKVNRITFVDASGVTTTFTGDIVIEARSNLRFKYESGKVILDAGDGLGLNKLCANSEQPILTINSIAPDEFGDFTLQGNDCAEFTAITNGLELNDSCCKPCAGCDEISELTDRTNRVETNLLDIRNYYNTLLQEFSNFKTTVDFSCDC